MQRKKTEFPRGNAGRYAKIHQLIEDGLLQVTEDGTVTWKGKVVEPKPIGKGYLRVKFYIGDYVDFNELHHRFVYMAVKGEIPDGLTIDHIDKNRQNNHISNLRLMTLAENSSIPGEANGSAKLKEADVAAIRAAYATGRFSQQQLADQYGIDQTNVSRIVLRKNWL